MRLEGMRSFRFRSGSVYNGQWLDNARHGFGSQTWSDGARFVGFWRQNLAEGRSQKSSNRVPRPGRVPTREWRRLRGGLEAECGARHRQAASKHAGKRLFQGVTGRFRR